MDEGRLQEALLEVNPNTRISVESTVYLPVSAVALLPSLALWLPLDSLWRARSFWKRMINTMPLIHEHWRMPIRMLVMHESSRAVMRHVGCYSSELWQKS
jgi:hypothetical protein